MTVEDIARYVAAQSVLGKVLKHDRYDVYEIGGGNLNFIFRVQGVSGNSLIIKHAPPYLRMLGETFALTQERICAEMHTMRYFQTIAPSYVPHVYLCDEERFCFAMEDLREFRLMQNRSDVPLCIYEKLGDFLALLFLNTPPPRLEGYYENAALKRISDEYIFCFPHIADHPALVRVPYFTPRPKSPHFDATIAWLRTRFLEAKEHLLHGDLHTGSVMSDGCDLKIIDAEFAFFGPLGFDAGVLIAHILFDEIHAYCSDQTVHYTKRIQALFRGFEARAHTVSLAFLRESVGFCGAELYRRLLVPAKAKPLEALPNVSQKAQAYALSETLAIDLVEACLHVESLEDFLARVERRLCPKTR